MVVRVRRPIQNIHTFLSNRVDECLDLFQVTTFRKIWDSLKYRDHESKLMPVETRLSVIVTIEFGLFKSRAMSYYYNSTLDHL